MRKRLSKIVATTVVAVAVITYVVVVGGFILVVPVIALHDTMPFWKAIGIYYGIWASEEISK